MSLWVYYWALFFRGTSRSFVWTPVYIAHFVRIHINEHYDHHHRLFTFHDDHEGLPSRTVRLRSSSCTSTLWLSSRATKWYAKIVIVNSPVETDTNARLIGDCKGNRSGGEFYTLFEWC